MKNLQFKYLIILLSIAIQSNAQWSLLNYPTDKNLRLPQYTSATKLWALESSDNGIDPHIVLTSVDGLINFTRSTTTFSWIDNLYAINDEIGYLKGSPLGQSRTLFYKTTDGGITWDSLQIAPNNVIGTAPFLICFDTFNLCIITSRITNGCFDYYTSNNGGNSWNKQTACPQILNGVNRTLPFFLSRNQYSSTTLLTIDSFLFKTNDFGNTWIVNNNANFRRPFRTIAFKDSLNGIAFRRYTDQQNQVKFSTLHFTSDGGVTWDSLTNTLPPINEVRYLKKRSVSDQPLFIAGGEEGAIYSNDSAITWKFFDNEMHSSMAFNGKEAGLTFYPVSSGGKGLQKFIGPFTSLAANPSKVSHLLYLIYPNPANDELKINYYTLDSETEFIITDLTGKTIKSFRVKNASQENTITVNTSDMVKGIYFLNAFNLGRFKFIKD